MQNFSNIERSGFRAGEYVGYGGGAVYRIKRAKFYPAGAGWLATWHSGTQPASRDAFFSGRTLADLSARLGEGAK